MVFQPKRVIFTTAVHGEFGDQGPVAGDKGLYFRKAVDVDGDEFYAVAFNNQVYWCYRNYFEFEGEV